ncbi:heavy-metal-associated domain-containing protein [Methanobrevibacter sp.]|uniref:heavy-metal-associated domain-containing protein n=1 Tax=Methanobrevibacter sp. TaxID=66852 RepID=UPI002602BA31|nr:heavy-metal-associated domain-containing protein [uncultured Methanobrevibacter sp.]
MSIEKKFFSELESISEFEGVQNVLIDLNSKTITIDYDEDMLSEVERNIINSTVVFYNEKRTDIGYRVIPRSY